MAFYRFSRWDGTQQVFDLDEEDLMEQLSEHLVNNGDVAQVLEAMIQRGLRSRYGQDVPGIDQILQQLRDKKQQLLDQYNLDHILEDIERKLQQIVDTERAVYDNLVKYSDLHTESNSAGLELCIHTLQTTH